MHPGGRNSSAGIAHLGLTFAITWTAWWGLVVAGVAWGNTTGTIVFGVGGFGPLLAAMAMLYWREGTAARHDFWRRLIDWRRVGLRWWAIIGALAVMPNLVARLLPLEAGDEAAGLDARAAGIFVVAIVAGFAEEPGWRGYAQDRLGAAWGHAATAVAVGATWTLWHLPLYFIEGSFQQELGFGTSLMFFAGPMSLAVIYAWLFVNTGHSTLAVVVAHALLNAGGEIVPVRDQAQFAVLLSMFALSALLIVALGSDLRRDVARRGVRPPLPRRR